MVSFLGVAVYLGNLDSSVRRELRCLDCSCSASIGGMDRCLPLKPRNLHRSPIVTVLRPDR